MSRDLEERYLETRDRNLLLRKKNNEQEQTIKRLYTKIQMIEEGLRRRGHGSTMDASKSKTRTNKMDDVAYMQVKDLTKNENEKVFIFNGWTFASDPSLTPFDHAIYDIQLLNCYNV